MRSGGYGSDFAVEGHPCCRARPGVTWSVGAEEAEVGSQRGWQRNAADAAGLGLFDGDGAGCLRRGSLDLDSAGVEIAVADLEAEGFADAQAGECQEADEQAEFITGLVVWPRRLTWRAGYLRGQRFNFLG